MVDKNNRPLSEYTEYDIKELILDRDLLQTKLEITHKDRIYNSIFFIAIILFIFISFFVYHFNSSREKNNTITELQQQVSYLESELKYYVFDEDDLTEAENEGYEKGKEDGYIKGYSEGEEHGYISGYNDCRDGAEPEFDV